METYDYRGPDSFHPAFDITLDMAAANPQADVRRLVDFETGEVIVTWNEGQVIYRCGRFV